LFPEEKQKPHYHVLGVTQTSTLTAIKREYRKRALSLHPDKVDCGNLDRTDCQLGASRNFANIRHAYEILTDPEKRRVYDHTGRDLSSEDPFFQEWWRKYKGPLLTSAEKFAMERVIETFGLHHFKSLACLEYPIGIPKACVPEAGYEIVTLKTTLDKAKKRCSSREACKFITYEGTDLDPEDTLSITLREEAECVPDVDENFLTWTKLEGDYLAEKNLLIAFFEEDCERILRIEIKYPLPFSGWRHKDKRKGLWWEDYILTYQHESLGSDLAQFFGVSKCPTFVFVWQWSPISVFEKFHTTNQTQFRHWVWDNLRTQLTIVNKHPFSVVIYWESSRGWVKKYTLAYKQSVTEHTIVGHRYLAREERYDEIQGHPKQGIFEEREVIRVEGDYWTLQFRCRNDHKECEDWASKGECENNREYLQYACRKSCGTCGVFDSLGSLKVSEEIAQETDSPKMEL